jgi:RecA-family ATPase
MEILTLDSILNDNSQPPEQLIGDGVFLKESLLLITGAKKVRKTFLSYNLGIALASGYSFAGFDIKNKNKVLILSAEGGYYPNRERIQTMCKEINQEDELLLNICFDPRTKLENDDDYDNIKQILDEKLPDILIIDPFVKFHSLDENSAKDMGKILDRIRMLITDHHLSIILVHHLGKDQTHGARGSSAILGEYDSCITLTKEGSEAKSTNRIEFDLRHAISPESRILVFNKESFWFEEDISPFIKLITELGEMSKKELIELSVSKNLYPQSTAYKRFAELEAQNKLILGSNGKYQLPVFN